jgi:hypothetical protein
MSKLGGYIHTLAVILDMGTIDFDKIGKLITLLRPKYYNVLTRILLTAGIALVSKPIWIDILNLFLVGFKFGLIGEYDWALGLALIFLSLIYNTINRYLDLSIDQQSRPAFNDVKFKRFNSFGELCQEILPLLRDNEYIFKTTGPNSGSGNHGDLRTDLSLWDKLKKEAILPNNEAIKRLINDNKDLVPDSFKTLFKRMLLHIEAFNAHVQDPKIDYSEYQFPQEFAGIISQKSYETAQDNKLLIKKKKWLTKRLQKHIVVSWFLFGSSVFTPSKSKDTDIVILISEPISSNNEIVKTIEHLKLDFKIKFKQGLHITLFDLSNAHDYKDFSNKNPLKIEVSNG